MTLRTRLSLGLAAVALVLVLPQMLAVVGLQTVGRSMRALRERDFAASLAVGRVRAGTEELPQLDLATIAVPDSSEPRERLARTLDSLTLAASEMSRLGLDAEAQEALAQIRIVAEATARQRALARAGLGDDADQLSATTTRPAIAAIARITRGAERRLRGDTEKRVNDAATRAGNAIAMSVGALVAALALAATIAIWLTRSISRPVGDLQAGMAAVADGDFGHKLPIRPDRRDEFGRLAESYDAMTAQLTELDKLKAEFVSVASHELKTPINVILGYLQLLEDNLYGDLTPKQREVIRTLTTQGHNLNRLVKNLLDVSRFEAGGGRLEPRRIVLTEFLAELEEAFHVLARQREVAFAVEVREDVPREVAWDADRMNEVLGNLLSNAFKFTDRGGRVSLTAESVAGKVQLTVRDTGAGIPPEQLPRIFDKFYQADNQGAASAKGTGLGLAIAKGIVEAHGGTIFVESTPGSGTTFVLVLPQKVVSTRRSAPIFAITDERPS